MTMPKSGPFRGYLRSRRGGGMLVGCVLTLVAMLGFGGTMVNYSWREAQREEMDGVLRAAIAAAGSLLGGAGDTKIDEQILDRIAEFAAGAMAGLAIDTDCTDGECSTVSYASDTGIATLSLRGSYGYDNVFGSDEDEDEDSVFIEKIRVVLDAESYEVAVALDLSASMKQSIAGPNNTHVIKLNALKLAMGAISDTMQEVVDTNTGNLSVSLIPFAAAVNVADTGGTGQTPGKRRYLRMLAGAPAAGENIDDTRAAARQAVAAGWGHWVDSFHHYGVGADLGALRKQSLPSGLLYANDWNLRRTNVAVNVAAQVPELGTWQVNDEDFWNGCVMARWGAYWDPKARPGGWDPNDAGHWPAKKGVGAWSAKGTALGATTPVHLSDAPPDRNDPNTLFTAYSWPDARIGGNADHRLQTAMATLLEAPDSPKTTKPLDALPTKGDNDWSAAGSQRGKAMCPPSPISPLSADVATVKTSVDNLKIACLYPDCGGRVAPINRAQTGSTYLHLGIVWGLRTLSPLWQGVWEVKDRQGTPLPEVTCATGESTGCNSKKTKSIVVVTDGLPDAGSVLDARLRAPHPVRDGSRNMEWRRDLKHCTTRTYVRDRRYLKKYHAAAESDTPQAFDANFQAYLDGGKFGGTRIDDVVDAFRPFDRFQTLTQVQYDARKAVLEKYSPWQLFRGQDASVTDELMNEANAFGFDHRPVQMGHFCRPTSTFSPYGRVDDTVYVGEMSGAPLPPAHGVAPFTLPTSFSRSDYDDVDNYLYPGPMEKSMERNLDAWLQDACRISGERGVRIHAIYIGDRRTPHGRRGVSRLERCVDAAGGDPAEDEVYVTPNADTLRDAFKDRFAIRRTLRFLD